MFSLSSQNTWNLTSIKAAAIKCAKTDQSSTFPVSAFFAERGDRCVKPNLVQSTQQPSRPSNRNEQRSPTKSSSLVPSSTGKSDSTRNASPLQWISKGFSSNSSWNAREWGPRNAGIDDADRLHVDKIQNQPQTIRESNKKPIM